MTHTRYCRIASVFSSPNVTKEWIDNHPDASLMEDTTLVFVCQRCNREMTWHNATSDVDQFKTGG